MTEKTQMLFEEALLLPPIERAELIENLLSSFDFPDRKEIDALWGAEAERRIDAYEKGEAEAVSVDEVFNAIANGGAGTR